jgi:hypothetical protein
VDVFWEFIEPLLELYPDADLAMTSGIVTTGNVAWNLPLLEPGNPLHADLLRECEKALLAPEPGPTIIRRLTEERREKWAHDPRLIQVEVTGMDGDEVIVNAKVMNGKAPGSRRGVKPGSASVPPEPHSKNVPASVPPESKEGRSPVPPEGPR